ncbi:TetR/AcrR family transcriptional regulator C-terminal ligand-binding domain-containing protein [Actinoplanes sp. CA-054009]
MAEVPLPAPPAAETPPSRRGRTRSEPTRRAILAATRDELAAHGYDKLSIDRIAAAAGAGKQTVYRWYPSKSSLIADCLLETEVLDGPSVPHTTDIRADLRTWLHTFATQFDRPNPSAASAHAASIAGSAHAASIAGSDHAASIAGSDRAASIAGSDRAASIAGSDRAASIAGSDRAASIAGSDRAASIAGSDRAASIAGSDRAASIAGSDRAASIAGSDRAASIAGSDRAASIAASDHAAPIAGSDRAASIAGSDRAASIAASDHAASIAGSGRADSAGASGRVDSAGRIGWLGSAAFIRAATAAAAESDEVAARFYEAITAGAEADLTARLRVAADAGQLGRGVVPGVAAQALIGALLYRLLTRQPFSVSFRDDLVDTLCGGPHPGGS